jgi:FtsH-binding integral membrane protein
MFINTFGGIVALVWLIVIGDYWFLIGAGVFALFFSAFGLGLLMLPSTGVQMAGFKLIEKKQKVLGYIFLYFGNLLLLAAFASWIIYVYAFGLSNVQNASDLFPIMLWCYGVATGPIYWMASKEGKNSEGTQIMTFFISIGCIGMTIMISFFYVSLYNSMIFFLLSVFFSINLLFYESYKISKMHKR